MNSIVLLSGGMDSAYAAVYASANFKPLAFLFVRYGQRGQGYEMAAAATVAGWCIRRYDLSASLHVNEVEMGRMYAHPLGSRDADLDPTLKDSHGNPATFVPGRNLLMLSMAAGLAYELGATNIIGGWNQVDVSYPDCTADFLIQAERAINLALGVPIGTFHILAPVLRTSKADIVSRGREREVPFHLTRSCYGDSEAPCGRCDSCIVRARAFMANGIRDLIYTEEQWTELEGRLHEQEQGHGNPCA